MPQAVGHQDRGAPLQQLDAPRVAAHALSRLGKGDRADVIVVVGGDLVAIPDDHAKDRAPRRPRVGLELAGLSADRTQARSPRAGGGRAVTRAIREALHPGPRIDGEHLDADRAVTGERTRDERSAPRVLEDVAHGLGCDDRHGPGTRFPEAQALGHALQLAARGSHVARILDMDRDGLGDAQRGLHFTMTTRVPFPGAESMWNSSESRLAPPNPRPRPLPVVKPSLRAFGMSGIPGPSSQNSRRMPRRPPCSSEVAITFPPPP